MDPLIEKGTALITGSGSGLGQAIAVKFAAQGCRKLYLVDLNMQGLQNTQALVERANEHTRVVLRVVDITNSDQVKDMVQDCVNIYGRLDFAINNAGFAAGGTKTADLSIELFDKMCNVNEKGVFLCLKYQMAQMLKQEPLEIDSKDFEAVRGVRGSVISTGSLSTTVTLKDFSGYTSSKHGVGMMIKQAAREYAQYKIRVNAINPGAVMTPMIAASGLTKQFLDNLSSQAPMNRLILAEEVADMAVWLSSSRASAITGVLLPVDCGASLYHLES